MSLIHRLVLIFVSRPPGPHVTEHGAVTVNGDQVLQKGHLGTVQACMTFCSSGDFAPQPVLDGRSFWQVLLLVPNLIMPVPHVAEHEEYEYCVQGPQDGQFLLAEQL